jgi:Ca2+-binding EF-hand superfamily protein
LQFPSQQNIVDDIIPAIEKLETNDQKIPQNCQIEAIESYMVILLRNNTYSSYDKDHLIKAFKALDTTNTGYVDLHTLFYLLKNFGTKFDKKVLKDMEDFCLENENDLLDPMPFEENLETPKKHDQYTTRKFFYENYIRKIDQDNRRRYNNLMSEYLTFVNNQTGSKN